MTDQTVILPAYVDEAGARGLVRDLTPERDGDFGLMCAVLFEPNGLADALSRFAVPFEAFKAAAPPGAKLHITDAFKLGNEGWRPVAERVRGEYVELMNDFARPMVVYAARRLRFEREAHERASALVASAKEGRRSPVKIVGGDRPSDVRIEDELIQTLSLMLDAFVEDMGRQLHDVRQVDLFFDEVDVAQRYEAIIQRTREVSRNATVVKGWNPSRSERVEGTIDFTIDAPFRIDTRYVGGIHVVGKDHPLVFAADIVANHLHHHLRGLPADAPLNAPSSISGWALRDRVWGVMDDASSDLF